MLNITNNKEMVRTGKRDRNAQRCDPSAATAIATTTTTTMKDQATTKENTAWRWWNDHLKPSDWIKFTPKAKFCELDGFIPFQYKMDRDNRKAVAHVLKHGERGVHYAIGWKELYRLVKRYGELELSTTFRPGTKHEIMLDYKGPPLAIEEQSSNKKTGNKPITTAPASPTGPPGPGLYDDIPPVAGLQNSKCRLSGLRNVTYEQDDPTTKFGQLHLDGPSYYEDQVPGNRSLIFTKTNKRKHGSKELSLPPPNNSTSNGEAKSTSLVESGRRHVADAANDELPKALKAKVSRKSSTTQNFEEWCAAQDKLAIAAFIEGYTETLYGKAKRCCQ
jgi:hypothetical protein